MRSFPGRYKPAGGNPFKSAAISRHASGKPDVPSGGRRIPAGFPGFLHRNGGTVSRNSCRTGVFFRRRKTFRGNAGKCTAGKKTQANSSAKAAPRTANPAICWRENPSAGTNKANRTRGGAPRRENSARTKANRIEESKTVTIMLSKIFKIKRTFTPVQPKVYPFAAAVNLLFRLPARAIETALLSCYNAAYATESI